MSIKPIKNNVDLNAAERKILVEAIRLQMERKNHKSKGPESHHELQVNKTDLGILIDLLENPRPANNAMKNLMGLLDKK